MKNFKLILVTGLFALINMACSLEPGVFEVADDNELSAKRQKWAQFEEKRTEKELSIWQ